MDRMDREQFFARLGALDEERLKKALWNLYWRGTATIRQRIEAELDPDGPRPRRKEPEPADPEGTLDEVRDFVALARSGAYLAGDRRVRPRGAHALALHRYIEALDEVVARRSATASSRRRPKDTTRDRLTSDLAEWHAMLVDRLFGSDSEDRLDRLATHPALGGPDLIYLQAQLARRRGDLVAARRLVTGALERLPGHRDYLALKEIAAPLPDRARDLARSRYERLMGS